MKRILVGIFCILSVTSVFAQKTEDMYVMRHSSEGDLYFIRPIQFSSADSKAELSYDITHLSTKDTASVKMTIYETTLVSIDSVALVSNGARFLCDDVVSILCARSGLASKKGIALANGIGVVDSDYRGEIMVSLVNLSDAPYTVANGERIAQLMFLPIIKGEFSEGELSDTKRGIGGFGSTGKN